MDLWLGSRRNGAPVTNADIEAVDDSGVSHSAQSDSMRQLPAGIAAGKYEITVSAAGFADFTQSAMFRAAVRPAM